MRLDNKSNVNRLLIYFFYDADGIVDRYVPYMLEGLREHCTEIFVICNGKLTPEGRGKLENIADEVYVRENKGFDVWAYKTALEHYGWDKLAEYDEVIMMNHTIMGPIYPFKEMFDKMNSKDLDFWGITAYHKVPYDPFGTISFGYIPWHIQSSFIAVRNKMLKSSEFHDYWKTRPEINNYNDAVGKHEAIFTKTFQDKGYVCESYIDDEYLRECTDHPISRMPLEMARDYRCPIFKRKLFFNNYEDFLWSSTGGQNRQLLEFLDKETDYDIDMVWENILRTCNMADIKACLHLNYILPNDSVIGPETKCRTALVMHLYFEDLIEYCYQYALSMPKSTRVVITTDTEKKAEKIREIFLNGVFDDVHIIVAENRGRDVGPLLVEATPYIFDADLVCAVHDKKVKQLSYLIKGKSFSDRCFENCLSTPEYVQNIIHTMMSSKRMGMLCPPPPNFADYYPTIGMEWGPNFEMTKKLADKLELKVNISQTKEPVAPVGGMFWFKPNALKPLFDYRWKYEDFPKEPIEDDGTILHAIERIYPYVAQNSGYYAGWCMTTPQAQLEWNNLYYMLRNINVGLFNIYGPQPFNNLHYLLASSSSLIELPKDMRKRKKRILKKQKIKKIIPKPIWEVMRKTYHALGGKKWIG